MVAYPAADSLLTHTVIKGDLALTTDTAYRGPLSYTSGVTPEKRKLGIFFFFLSFWGVFPQCLYLPLRIGQGVENTWRSADAIFHALLGKILKTLSSSNPLLLEARIVYICDPIWVWKKWHSVVDDFKNRLAQFRTESNVSRTPPNIHLERDTPEVGCKRHFQWINRPPIIWR